MVLWGLKRGVNENSANESVSQTPQFSETEMRPSYGPSLQRHLTASAIAQHNLPAKRTVFGKRVMYPFRGTAFDKLQGFGQRHR